MCQQAYMWLHVHLHARALASFPNVRPFQLSKKKKKKHSLSQIPGRHMKPIATLALGRDQGKGIARLRAKRKEAWESRQRHCKGVGQEEVGESHYTLPRV
jgi:hypothetical protein